MHPRSHVAPALLACIGACIAACGSASIVACSEFTWDPKNDALFAGQNADIAAIGRDAGPNVLGHIAVIPSSFGVTGDTWVAEVGLDGKLGPWRSGAPLLPGPQWYAAGVAHGAVYVAGLTYEADSLGNADTIVHFAHAPLVSDGFGDWLDDSQTTMSLAGPFVFASNADVLLLTGAFGAGVAPFQGSALGAWAAATPLPRSFSGSSAAAVGDHVYVFGGTRVTETGQEECPDPGDDVYDGRVAAGAGGAIAWQPAPAVPNPAARRPVVAYGNRLIALGGASQHYGIDCGEPGQPLASVDVATLAPDGSIQRWTSTAPYTRTRTDHCAVVVGSYLYVIGGIATALPGEGFGGATDSVEIAKLAEDGTVTGAWQEGTALPDVMYDVSCVSW